MNSFARVAALTLLVVLVCASPLLAQTKRPSSAAASPTRSLIAMLPNSDVVVHLDVHQLLSDVIPSVLASDKAKLDRVNSEIDKFKTQTGIDARSFDNVAVGLKFVYPREGITKTDVVALARGSFNTAAIVEAGKIVASGNYREEKYNGKSLYVFVLNQDTKLFGLLDIKIRELALTSLEPNTLALGNVAGVKSAIDATTPRTHVANELIDLAMRKPDAIMGFGARLALALTSSLDLGDDVTAKKLGAIRHAYGSIARTPTGLDVTIVGQTEKPAQAKNLVELLEGLKQLAVGFIPGLSADKGKLATNAIDNLKITTQGVEMQITLGISQADLISLVGLI